MPQPAPQTDRRYVSDLAQNVITSLLKELGNNHAATVFAHRGWEAHLEKDLGLGSLERVELILRLETTLRIHLPERTLTEAETAGALVDAVMTQYAGPATAATAASAGTFAAGDVPANEIAAEALALPPSVKTLTEALLFRGQVQPWKQHILLYEEDTLHPITYGELLDGARAVGVQLQRAGLHSGETVALMLPTCAEFFWSFFGILLAGGIPVPLYPPFRADRIAEYAARQIAILRNAEARYLLTFREADRVAKLLQPAVRTLRKVMDAAEEVSRGGKFLKQEATGRPSLFLPHQAKPGELAFLQYTSGSTGSPKGVSLTHANLVANILAIGEAAGWTPSDVAVSWLPLYHDMGLIGAWLVPLFFGFPVVILSPLAFLTKPSRWLRAIHRHRGTLSPAPNFAYELCIRRIPEEDQAGLDLSCWRAALNGAEPVRVETVERFAERFGPCGFRKEALVPVYGLAEATLGVCSPPFGTGTRTARILREPFEREGRVIQARAEESNALQFVSVGHPLPGVEIRIVGPDGAELEDGHEGKLWFRSPAATQGYYRNPEGTAALLKPDGWLDSGDLAFRLNSEFYITGREKDIIIKSGRNLSPHEIEEIAGGVAGLRTGCAVAFGVPDERSGTERLVVIAELRKGADGEAASQEVLQRVSEGIGMPPDAVVLVPAGGIPKTSSGKLRRNETRRRYLSGALGKKPAPVWLQISKLTGRSAAPWLWSTVSGFFRRAGGILYGAYVLATVGICFGTARVLLAFTKQQAAAARLTRAMARVLVRLTFLHVEIRDAELLNDWRTSQPWIFAPNHSSYADIVLLEALLPAGARFVAKGEVLSMPVIRDIIRRAGHFAFDRSDAAARVAQGEAIERALREGQSVIIYPEGTFTPAAGVRPFQLGAFKAAVETRCPICPVVVRGARSILRDETLFPHYGRLVVTFGPLLRPEGEGWKELARLRDETRHIFSEHSGEALL